MGKKLHICLKNLLQRTEKPFCKEFGSLKRFTPANIHLGVCGFRSDCKYRAWFEEHNKLNFILFLVKVMSIYSNFF